MIRGSITGALALTLLLGACQTYDLASPVSLPAPTPMDGTWGSTDGVFVAIFERGNFTSRFVKTNEILAQGTYTVSGPGITMQWMSVATQQQRSANCSFTGADTVACTQDGGGSFDLRRAI